MGQPCGQVGAGGVPALARDRRARPFRLLGLLGLLALLLSGCLKLDADLAVGADNTVSGSYVIAYVTDPNRPAGAPSTARPLLVNRGEVRASRYDDGTYRGFRYRLDHVGLADLAEFSAVTFDNRQTGTIRISRDGNDFVVTGTFDFRARTPAARPAAEEQKVRELFRVRVRLTFPGEVETANGSIAGRTVTWQIPPFSRTTLAARASAGTAAPAGPGDGHSWVVGQLRRTAHVLGGLARPAGLILALLAGFVLVVRTARRRRSRRRRPVLALPPAPADPSDFSWLLGERPTRPAHAARSGLVAPPATPPSPADRTTRQ